MERSIIIYHYKGIKLKGIKWYCSILSLCDKKYIMQTAVCGGLSSIALVPNLENTPERWLYRSRNNTEV